MTTCAATETGGDLLGQTQQRRAVALPLRSGADADEAQSHLHVVDQVDPHHPDDVAGEDENVRQVPGLELVGVGLVIRVTREQRGKDRVAPDRMIGAPIRRRQYAP